jgi:hypothetical protein
VYQKIFTDSTSIDIAFIGSSHTWHAVNDYLIETRWNSTRDDSIHFLNLGYCRFGRNIHYLLLKDLLEKKKLKAVVLEITPEEDHYSHIDFGYLADARDLFGAPLLVNKDYFSDLFKGFISRFEQFRSQLFGNSKSLSPIDSRFGYGADSSVMDSLNANSKLAALQNQPVVLKTGFNEFFYLNYPRQYLRKIYKITSEHHVPLLFLYLPSFTTSADKPFYKSDYTDHGEIIFPPDSVFRNRLFWIDNDHLNDRGARAVSEKIYEELSEKWSSNFENRN